MEKNSIAILEQIGNYFYVKLFLATLEQIADKYDTVIVKQIPSMDLFLYWYIFFLTNGEYIAAFVAANSD